MPEFYSTNKIVYLGREVGRGGEGIVYEVADQAELVAKIYHEPINAEKSEKLRQMVALQNAKLLNLAAWVTDVLRDKPEGKIVGFLMPKINFGTAIHELYNPQSRRQHFPAADWRFLLRAAANLARAFSVIHAHGHAVGDVNHGNVVIGRDATVRLIDCDSYHLNAPDKSYLCEVGVSTHTPPELQNHSLRSLARTANHDAFGLAVLIFQLLFMGRHPFSGNFQGDGENTLENSIQNRRFAYGDGATERLMKQPPGTLPLSAVSFKAARLFERAFLQSEDRPTAREWIAALEELEQNLHQCAVNSGHYYLETLKKCPWCRLEGQTGVLFFPAKFTGNFESDDGELDLYTLGNLIDAIKPPELAPDLPVATQNLLVPTGSLPPSPLVAKALGNYKTNLAVFLVAASILVFFVSYFFGFGSIFWMGFAGYWVLSEVVKSMLKVPEEDTQLRADAARQNWQNFKESWSKNALIKSFENSRRELKAKVNEYRELPRQKEAQSKEHEAKIYQQQLNSYLKSFLIKDADLFGLSDERLNVLTDSKIQTAAEVDGKTLPRIPQFTHNHQRILLEWRHGLERKFVFKPLSPQSAKRIFKELEDEITARERRLETELRGGLTGLHQFSLQLTKKQKDLSLQSEQFAADLAQAESDLKHVGELKTQAIGWMIFVAIIFFTIGVSIRQLNVVPTVARANVKETSEVPRVRISHDPTTSKIVGTVNVTKNVADKITSPTVSQKHDSANWGTAGEYYQAGERAFSSGDYRAAITEYNLAARANPRISFIYHKMGRAYFQLAEYDDAIESYQKALKIEPHDSDTWHQLGAAYKKINHFDDAAAAFKKAVENNPNAEMSYYELGLSYARLGKQSLAQKQYDLLDKMHSPVAEQLWQELKESEAPPAPVNPKLVLKD